MPLSPETVAILICTRNRADSLKRTLEAIKKLPVPENLVGELLVIDNGSTDQTRQVVENVKFPNMQIRYVLEPCRGQSNARNTGLAKSTAEVVLFTDDDVRPPANWIGEMCGPILGGHADAVAGGVKLADHLERPWLTPKMRSWIASTETVESEGRQRLIGANMAFSRQVLEKVPGFDPELGPGALGFGDDTLFSLQLAAAGFRIVNAFDTAVEHHFDPARLTREAFLNCADKMGRSNAYMSYHWAHTRPNTSLALGCYLKMRLALGRAMDRSWGSEVPTDRELENVVALAAWKQYRIESKRPRQYEKFGLVKKESITPGMEQAAASL